MTNYNADMTRFVKGLSPFVTIIVTIITTEIHNGDSLQPYSL